MSQRPIVRPSVFARKALGFNLYPIQEKVVDSLYLPNTRTSYLCCNSGGKALAIDTPILTPSGWSTMGDLKEGDFIFGSDGKPCKVTFATEVMHGRPCNRIRFDEGDGNNGKEIIADDEHLWLVQRCTKNGIEHESVKSTKQIREDISSGGVGYRIPIKHDVEHCDEFLKHCGSLEYFEDRNTGAPYIGICEIFTHESVPVKCIQVDSPDHCYLAGRNLTPTHNTSRVLTTLILWHLFTWPKGKVKTTSGSYIQIQDQLVPSLAVQKEKFEDDMEFMATPHIRVKDDIGFWRGFSTNEPGRAEGDHADGEERPFLFIIDEAKTVPDSIFQAADRCVGLDSPARLLIASSPGFAEGVFYNSQNINKNDWQVFRQTAYDTPHIKPEAIEKIKQRWQGFPAFVNSMLGVDFMPLVEDAIIDLKALDYCLANPKGWVQGDKHAFCDFAWSTDGDENVLALCHGNRATLEATFHADNINDICNKFERNFIRLGLTSGCISADEGGGGKMIIDELENRGWHINRINNQSPANDEEHYNSIAAEVWYEGSKKIYDNSIIIPNDPELRGQLLSRKRIKGSKGRLAVESKRDMKKRGVPSPDRADAILNSIAPIGGFQQAAGGTFTMQPLRVGSYQPVGY